MRVNDVVHHMTKQYLDRVIDSFTKDFPKLDEDRARDAILRNADELTDSARIGRQLSFDGARYPDRILQTFILRHLLACPDHACDEPALIDAVTAAERAVVDAAADPESLRWEDERALGILEAVIDVALHDDVVSDDELRLIERLREKLRIRERSKEIVMARLGHFPGPGNQLHAPSDFRNALNDLQRRGVVFYCNRLDGGRYVIPDEIAPGVKKGLGIELTEKPWRLLLANLSNAHLGLVLEAAGLPKSGAKDDRVERIVAAGIHPSAALDSLSNQDLYNICDALPGANVSGSKAAKIERVIDYFENLVVKDVPTDASPGERYYEYLAQLARRDRESLLANKVIRKDIDMERAFEVGLRWLFTEKLGLSLLDQPGSDHADGALAFPNGDLFLWDAKSREDVYAFPPTHMKQFKRYIRDAATRVSCFLVIAPEIAPAAAHMAARLKVETKTDTDVSLIAAEDLVRLAEQWTARKPGQPINLEVFNITGVLDRTTLDGRMRLFR